MAKEAFYFTHDYGSRNDPKLQKVLMKLGHEGKSVYWDLVEMLYEEGGYLILEECENYAFALRTHYDCIAKLINDFDLFQKDDKNFWSNSVLRRLDKRDEKSKKASESAKTRWAIANALKKDANASKSDAIKEKKGKEKKEGIAVASLSVQQSGEVFKSVKKQFLEEYAIDFKTEYYFQAKDGAKIYEIIKKVFFKMKEKDGRESFTVQELSDGANFFLKATFKVADDWLRSNFNLSNIDSKFNDIYSQIKNRSNGTNKIRGHSGASNYNSAKSAFGVK